MKVVALACEQPSTGTSGHGQWVLSMMIRRAKERIESHRSSLFERVPTSQMARRSFRPGGFSHSSMFMPLITSKPCCLLSLEHSSTPGNVPTSVTVASVSWMAYRLLSLVTFLHSLPLVDSILRHVTYGLVFSAGPFLLSDAVPHSPSQARRGSYPLLPSLFSFWTFFALFALGLGRGSAQFGVKSEDGHLCKWLGDFLSLPSHLPARLIVCHPVTWAIWLLHIWQHIDIRNVRAVSGSAPRQHGLQAVTIFWCQVLLSPGKAAVFPGKFSLL